jgi:hypothetical protein
MPENKDYRFRRDGFKRREPLFELNCCCVGTTGHLGATPQGSRFVIDDAYSR